MILLDGLLELVFWLVGPEPGVSGEIIEELANRVLGTLERTCKGQDDKDDFLVLGKPV